MNHPLTDMLGNTMDKIRSLVDANTIVGTPISTPDGVTLIPVSKVSFGYAGGGSDFASKNSAENPFGGGGGGGVNITPVAFLVVKEGNVRVLPITDGAPSSVDRLLDMLPEIVDKVNGMLKSRKTPEEPEDEVQVLE
ncbi:MAG: GerW family sporulation protein [Oscillospiraceae bacterium]|nr:GerW family sporulation protein [Oscillospiraceae bacterium]